MHKIKNYAIYLICTVINSSIPLLLIPIITVEFSVEENGFLSYFNIYTVLAGTVLSLGLTNYHQYIYFREKRETVSSYLFSALVFTFSLCILTVCVLRIGRIYFSNFAHLPFYYSILIPLNMFFAFIPFIGLYLLRNEEKATSFSILAISYTLLNAGLSIYLIYQTNLSWESRTFSIIATNVIFAIVHFVYLIKNNHIRFRFNFEHLKKGIHYSLPLVPSTLAILVLDMSDKLLLGHFLGVSSVGGYDIGYKFGNMVYLLFGAINLAFAPFLYRCFSQWEKKEEKNLVSKEQLVGQIYLIHFILIVGVFMALAVSKFLYQFGYVGTEFQYSYKFVPIVVFGMLFYCFYSVQSMIIIQSKKTNYILFVVAFCALINILLNYIFIPIYGDIAPAWTTLISYFLMFLLMLFISVRLVPLPWLDSKTFWYSGYEVKRFLEKVREKMTLMQ